MLARENDADTVDISLCSAIDATFDVDLGLDPAAYREETVGPVHSVR